jgi:pimeloyl-ACP methyl ester carboxylesterase
MEGSIFIFRLELEGSFAVMRRFFARVFLRRGGVSALLSSGLFYLMTTALVGVISSYRVWQRKEIARIHENGVVIDTPVGPIEYQVSGHGPAVIYAHGTPGGYDQGIAFKKFLDPDNCMLISPSRPGYLRTPRTSGPSPEEQADLYVALLDALHIHKASVIGFSGGGPSALQFALRYPERCQSLIMIGGIVRRHDYEERLSTLPLGKRLFSRLIEYLMVCEPFLYLVLPITRVIPRGSAVAGMLCSGTAYHLRKDGYDNDRQSFAALRNAPWEQITVPTLVVHGTEDEDVPFDDALFLAGKLQRVTLLALEKGDHSSFYTHSRVVMPMIRKFIAMNTP